METNLKKSGVIFMTVVAIMFGAIIGLSPNNALLVTVTTLVVIAAVLIIGHFLVTKKLDEPKRKPIELLIILFADIVFGLFAGSILGATNPIFLLLSAALVAICGFIAFCVLFLKNPGSKDALKTT
jgi:quinol-cytochrome oxidoreductase complex cytochrome b subunit